MIITKTKNNQALKEILQGFHTVFLVGCGECATTCKTGGIPELENAKKTLEQEGKIVTGWCVPSAPCVASQIKTELAKNMKQVKDCDAIIVFACGLGVQSVKAANRTNAVVVPALDTACSALMNAQGDFIETCSSCGNCLLSETGGICPVTLCAKGLLNGPCGGMDKGKCEVDKNKDCAWVLIHRELEKRGNTNQIKKIHAPRDYRIGLKPHHISGGKHQAKT